MLFKKAAVLIFIPVLLGYSSAAHADASFLDNPKGKELFNKPSLDLNSSNTIKVNDLVIQGTDKKEAIALALTFHSGDIVTESKIKENIQKIYDLGYFSQNINFTKMPYKDGYRVIITVEQNPVLQSLDVEGNTIVKKEIVKEIFKQQIGKTINFNDLKDGLEKLKDLYVSKGYEGILIVPDITEDGKINLEIKEGIIEEVKLVGNLETKDYVIMREIRQKPGELFNSKTFEEDRRRLINTNFFKEVQLKFAPGIIDSNHLIVTIAVTEQQTGLFNPGITYTVRDGLNANLSLSKINLFGSGQTVGLDLKVGAGWFAANSGWNFLGRLDWNDPWFLPNILPPRTGFGAGIYRQRESNLFQAVNSFQTTVNNFSGIYTYPLNNDRTGAVISINNAVFGDPLTSPWRTYLSVRAESVAPYIPSVQDVSIKSGNEQKNFNDLEKSTNQNDKQSAATIKTEFDSYVDREIRKGLTLSKNGFDNRVAVSLSLGYDTRDFIMEPHDGWNNMITVEPSFGDINYVRFSGNINKYFPLPLSDKFTLALSARGSILTGDKISIYERLYSSGADAIRGWPENGYLNGERNFISSAELRFPIYSILSGVAFMDAGNFWNQDWKVTDANVNDTKVNGKLVDQTLLNNILRFGFGLGLRLNTPFGMFRLDYGIRDISRPFDLNKGAQVHFNMGQKF
jgi:outer membrane protein insertion porin family